MVVETKDEMRLEPGSSHADLIGAISDKLPYLPFSVGVHSAAVCLLLRIADLSFIHLYNLLRDGVSTNLHRAADWLELRSAFGGICSPVTAGFGL